VASAVIAELSTVGTCQMNLCTHDRPPVGAYDPSVYASGAVIGKNSRRVDAADIDMVVIEPPLDGMVMDGGQPRRRREMDVSIFRPRLT